MKKILAGMLFRLLKGYEIWALLALFFVVSGYFAFVEISTVNYVAVKNDLEFAFIYDGEDTVITKENAEQFCYKNSGVSARDLYRYGIETIPQESFDKINKDMDAEPVSEVKTIFRLVFRSYLVASVLMMIFIPIFFGRMFSDGTIKNMISSGFSKALIYFSSLLLTFAIDLLLILMRLVMVAVFCVCFQWQPPIYLPVLIPAFLLSVLLSFTLTSVCLGALFAGGKKTLAFVLGFVMFAARFVSVSFLGAGLLWSSMEAGVSQMDPEVKEYLQAKGANYLERKIDLSQFTEQFYIEGETVRYMFADESSYPPAVVKTILVFIYGDPYLIDSSDEYMGFDSYSMARDGLMAVNGAVNTLWVVLINGVAILILNKRELHC